LFWYEKKNAEDEDEGKKTKDRTCMPIYAITDIYLGKQNTPIFQTKCANACPDDCALTIIGMTVSKRGKSDAFELYLEAESPAVAQEWLEALQHLLKEHGRELVDEGAETTPPPSAQSDGKTEGKVARRLSVVKSAATGKSDDPFDILGVAGAGLEYGFDEDAALVPASRPENPFGAAEGEDWNPFADSGDAPAGDGGGSAAADPFAGAGFEAFANPFAEAPLSPSAIQGLDPVLGKYLQEVGLMELAPKFAAEHVDLETLRMFTRDDFNGMGVKLGPSIKILNTLKSWKPK